jgi:hypothetical protein
MGWEGEGEKEWRRKKLSENETKRQQRTKRREKFFLFFLYPNLCFLQKIPLNCFCGRLKKWTNRSKHKSVKKKNPANRQASNSASLKSSPEANKGVMASPLL